MKEEVVVISGRHHFHSTDDSNMYPDIWVEPSFSWTNRQLLVEVGLTYKKYYYGCTRNRSSLDNKRTVV